MFEFLNRGERTGWAEPVDDRLAWSDPTDANGSSNLPPDRPPPSRPPPRRTRRSAIKSAVREFSLLHDFLQSGYRLGRLLFAQWPLALYCRCRTFLSKRSGVHEKGRAIPIIVSLTSYRPRLWSATVCIETLLRQTVRPDHLILWLAYEEDVAGVAASLHRLEMRGVEVRRCNDWLSFKKIVPAIQDHPEAIIVTADDDVFYPRNWLEKLLDAYNSDPHVIHCHRSHVMVFGNDGNLSPYRDWLSGNVDAGVASLLVFPTGVGGVLYPPGCLDTRVVDHELFMAMCSRADDIWLKAMSLLANTRCKQTRDFPERFLEVPSSQIESLWHTNVECGGNDEQLLRAFSYFGLLNRLRDEWIATGHAAASLKEIEAPATAPSLGRDVRGGTVEVGVVGDEKDSIGFAGLTDRHDVPSRDEGYRAQPR